MIDFEAGEFRQVLDGGLLTTSIMPVIHIKGTTARAVGTCFAISNDGLCLTARHVVVEALPGAFGRGAVSAEEDGWIYALYQSDERTEDNPDQHLGGLLPVQFAHFNANLDIAALQLSMLRHTRTGQLLRMPAQQIAIGLPTTGEFCFALGYHAMAWTGDGNEYRIEQFFSASRGVIEALHIPQRDAVMAPFPCFRTSARYDGGMSGGPVVGMDGIVKGVVCSSVHGLTDDDGYISYASLVAPAALIQVTRADEDGAPSMYFVNDLIERGIVPAVYQGTSFERLENELRLHIGGGTINSVLGL